MRRLVLLVYALVFVTELSQAAIVPLLPTFGRELSLSEVETGAILAATTFATVLVAVPIGLAADRLGPHRLTVGSGFLVLVASVVQALAPDFWVLLAGRALFGVAFATVWTAGLTLIAGATSGRRAGAIGGTIAVGGAAHFLGPLGSGFLAERLGLGAPFLVIAALAGLATVLLAATRPPAATGAAPRDSLRAALAAVRRHHELKTALVVMALLGVMAGIVPLLVPLLLDENGLTAGQIGAVFSAGAAIWIVASGAAARNAGRTVRAMAAGIGVVALGAVLVLPVLTVATAGIAAFVILRSVAQAPLSTISYPLADGAARVSGIGTGTVVGLTNLVWGIAAALSPLAGGALADGIGTRPTFGIVAIAVGFCGLWILAATRREHLRVAACDTAGG